MDKLFSYFYCEKLVLQYDRSSAISLHLVHRPPHAWPQDQLSCGAQICKGENYHKPDSSSKKSAFFCEKCQVKWLKNESVIFVQVGESPSLICDYDISADQLYSVKWYKDNMEFYRWLFILCERGNLWEKQTSLFPCWKCWNDIHRRWEFTICHDHRDDPCNNMWWITDFRWWGKSIRKRGWGINGRLCLKMMIWILEHVQFPRIIFGNFWWDHFICLSCNNMWSISDFRWQGKSIRIRWLGICS